MHRSSQIATAGAGVAAAVVLSVLPAAAVPARVAAPPMHGATYKGHVAHAISLDNVVSFRVSNDGKWVRAMRVGPYVLHVQSCGSGGAPPEQSTQPARIRNGKFTAHIVYGGRDKATVTGRFLRGGRETGVVTTHLVGFPNCGESRHYTTHVQ